MDMPNYRAVAAVAAILTALVVTFLAALAQGQPQVLDIVRGSTAKIRGLQCKAHIEVAQDTLLCTAGTFDVLYTLKLPDQVRVEVLSQRVGNPLKQPVPHDGSVYLFRDEDLIVYNSMRGMTKLGLRDLKDAHFQITSFPSDLPPLGPYAYALSKMFDSDVLPLQVTGTESYEGRDCYIVDAVLPEPLRPLEPHQIAKYRWWVDADRRVITRSQAYNENDQVIARLEHKDLERVAANRWVAMRTVATVEPGIAHLKVREDAEVAETSIQVGGYRVETRFRWYEDYGVRLPTERTYTDPNSDLICAVQFSDYVFNQGLHDLELRSWLR